MGLIKDMAKEAYEKRDLFLFARETCGPRDDKNYCFMGIVVDDRKSVVNVLTGEKYRNYSMRFPSIREEDGTAFYFSHCTSYDDMSKTTHFRLDAYDEDSVINGIQVATKNKQGEFPYKNMDKVFEYCYKCHGYVGIDKIKSMINQLNNKIHETLIYRQKVEEDLAIKREKYARKLAEDYKK